MTDGDEQLQERLNDRWSGTPARGSRPISDISRCRKENVKKRPSRVLLIDRTHRCGWNYPKIENEIECHIQTDTKKCGVLLR